LGAFFANPVGQCPKTTTKTNSHKIYLRKCRIELPQLIKADKSNSTDTLEGSLAGKIIDFFGPEVPLLIFIGIIALQTIIITLFVITKFYRKRSNNSNNQPPIPGNDNPNLAEYGQPRDFFRVSTDSHFYAEVGTGL
jgi:hypothetical protein